MVICSGSTSKLILADAISAMDEIEFPIKAQFASFCADGVFAPFFLNIEGVPSNMFCHSKINDASIRRKISSQNESSSRSVIQIRNPILCVEKGEIIIFSIETSK